jgi:hypothetical protein
MPSNRRHVIILIALGCALLCVSVASARSHRSRQNGPLPYMGAEPAPSIFGIDTGIYDSSYSNFKRDIPAARQLGARWDHFTIGPATGRGNYSALDHLVEQAKRNGMGVILSFGGIGSACSLKPRPQDIHACPPTTRADLRVYGAYVRRLLLHYRNVVDYYESWTEPNNRSSFLPGPDAGVYAAVLEAQYAAVQSVDHQYGLHVRLLFGSPSDFSVIPGSRGFVAVLPFTNKVLRDLHGRRAFDGIALHAYRFPPDPYGPFAPAYDYVGGLQVRHGTRGPFPGDGCVTSPWCRMTWPQELSTYEQEFADHGYGEQPLWLTEFGWPGNANAGGGYFPSEAAQTVDLLRAYEVLLRLPFVQGALWFNIRDYEPGFRSPDPQFFYHYGLLGYGFAPKPAAAEFAALARANPGR